MSGGRPRNAAAGPIRNLRYRPYLFEAVRNLRTLLIDTLE
jgi:hypothetical protein